MPLLLLLYEPVCVGSLEYEQILLQPGGGQGLQVAPQCVGGKAQEALTVQQTRQDNLQRQ
jgi:hypothetical protein